MTEQEKKVLAALQITDSITDLKQLKTLIKGCCLIAPDAVMEAVEGVYSVQVVETNCTPIMERVCYDSACKILSYMSNNQKIKAIKEWRAFTGAGLKVAKYNVDLLMGPNIHLPSIQVLMDQLEKERRYEQQQQQQSGS